VWVVGFGTDSAGIKHWLVRERPYGSASWRTVSDFNYAPGMPAVADGIDVDSGGRNFGVAGWAEDTAGARHWIVQRSSNGGQSWQTVDDYQSVTGRDAVASPITIDSVGGGVWVAGYATDSSGTAHWIVRESTDFGAHWLVIDDYVYPMGHVAFGRSGIVFDASGRLFAAGMGTDSAGHQHWLVRATY
jgi:hypothetical protein